MEAIAAWRRLLHHWIPTLHKHLYYHEREELECGSLHSEFKSFCVYIPWPVEDTDAYTAEVAQLREAMELVGLALRIDRNVWSLIRQPGNPALKTFNDEDYDDADLTPSFLVKAYDRYCDFPGDTATSIAILEQLLLPSHRVRTSAAYKHAREAIRSRDTRDQLTDFHVPISIVFMPDAREQDGVLQYMAIANRLVHGMDDRYRESLAIDRSNPTRYAFQLRSIVFHPWEHVADATVTCVHDFVVETLARGISIPEFAMSLADLRSLDRGQFLNLLSRQTSTGTTKRCVVDSLMLDDTAGLAPFIAACSAIASARTLSRLILCDFFEGDRHAKWRALGFALCSRASTSSVRELYLNVDELKTNDARALQQIIESLHPIQAICASGELTANDEPVDRWVRLCEDARIKLPDDDDALSTLSQMQLPLSDSYCVVPGKDESEWLRIFAPGYGPVLARCEDVVDVEFIPENQVCEPRNRVTQLHIGFDYCDRGAVGSILQVMGTSLVSLSLSAKTAKLVDTHDLKKILETCRSLKMLRLHYATIESMDIFTRAYEESECRISSLSLKNVFVSNASLCDFARTLENPSLKISKTLREFSFVFDCIGRRGEPAHPNLTGVGLFLDMLAVNSTLSFLELGLTKKLYTRLGNRFHKLHRQLLVSHPADLRLRSKLAFLSSVNVAVAKPQQKRLCSRADDLPSLTRELVARIFMFARKRIYRVVSVAHVGRTIVVLK